MISVALLLLASFVAAVPSGLTKRQLDTTEYCGQWDSAVAGQYTLYINQWGRDNAASGQSCANFVSLDSIDVAWDNSWTWVERNGGVKSYTNINLNDGLDVQLSAISSIPTTWSWSQTTEGNIVANIAYDLFTSSSAGGSNEFEIMIWMANINAGPISSVYNPDGTPQPIQESINIAGHTWDLFSGSNGVNWVYSFLTSDGSTITNFSGDLKDFLDYLTANTDLSESQYLVTVQSGTEATSGTADFHASSYTVEVL